MGYTPSLSEQQSYLLCCQKLEENNFTIIFDGKREIVVYGSKKGEKQL